MNNGIYFGSALLLYGKAARVATKKEKRRKSLRLTRVWD
jgi:hypothetical protein